MKIRHDLAEQAIGRLAERLGLGMTETAQGIVSVVTANMARAIRVISVQRGHDPRDYTLMAFGGAGPLHAARLARELEIDRVLVPRNPGILCAMGLLLTDLRADFAATRLLPLRPRPRRPTWPRPSPPSRQRADRWFGQRTIAPDDRRLARTVDMRYARPELRAGGAVARRARSRRRRSSARWRASPTSHRQRYGFAAEERPGPDRHLAGRGDRHSCARRAAGASDAGADASAAIVRAAGRCGSPEARDFVPTPDLRPRRAAARATASPVPRSSSRWTPPPLVPPGMTARVDAYLNLILEAA